MTRIAIKFITPLLSRGSNEDVPEIRPPSLRGQFHWWFRALGGTHADEKAVFGGVHQGATASKLIVRVANIDGTIALHSALPHKSGGEANKKRGYSPDTSFDLVLMERLGGIRADLRPRFERAIQAWLLMGTLGLRATRAAGSFTWVAQSPFEMPTTPTDYAARCTEVTNRSRLRPLFLPHSFATATEAITVVSDTIGGPKGKNHWPDLARSNWPLGNVGMKDQLFPGVPKRKTSPLRFRIVRLEDRFYIVALWDGRSEVTGNRDPDLPAIAKQLADNGKFLGRQLCAALT